MSRLAIGALVALIIAIAGAIVFGGPLVSWWKHRAADAEAHAERNADEAVAGSLTVEGTETIAAAANQAATANATDRRDSRALETQTRADPAVAIRVPPGELARIHAADLRLCEAGVLRCYGGPSAAPGATAGGPGAVRP